MKKALFVASVFGFLGSFEKNDIKILQEQGFDVFCASNCSEDLGAFGDVGQLDNLNITKCQIDFARSPFSKATITAYKQLKKLISGNDFELIHCHTPVGGILTRLAARKARKKGTKVIYTAHGFHFFKGAPLLNWLLYYPAEKICAHFTDALITINQEDYELAKKKMKARKVFYIPGIGVDTNKFANVTVDREKKRAEIGVPAEAVLLLSVGELNKNKNHEVVIRTLAKLNNSNVYYCIAGEGNLKIYLKELADSLNIDNKVNLLGYRNDIAQLYKSADVFCLPSHREGLSVSLMEVMSAGRPVVCSKIRGNVDLIQDEEGGYLCTPTSEDEFAEALGKLVINKELRESCGEYNSEYIKKFDVDISNFKMKEIYGEILNESTFN